MLAIAFAVLSMGAASVARAQVPPSQQPPAQMYPTNGAPQGYCPPRITPSAQVLYERYMRRFAPLGLNPNQQRQIQSSVDAFSQVHPAGSPLDQAAMHGLRDQVRGVLTPQQLALLEQQNHGHGMPHRCP
jgi:hypothetical protein